MRKMPIVAVMAVTAAAFAEGPSVASIEGGRIEISDPPVSFFMRIVYPKWQGQAVGRGEFVSEGDASGGSTSPTRRTTRPQPRRPASCMCPGTDAEGWTCTTA